MLDTLRVSQSQTGVTPPERMATLQPSFNFGGGGRNAFLFVGRAKRMGFALLIGLNPSIPPLLYLLNI